MLVGRSSYGDSVELESTPAVGEQLERTLEETAGLFFKPGSPLKADFREAGLTGVPTRITGFVLDRRGKPKETGNEAVREPRASEVEAVIKLDLSGDSSSDLTGS